ncbi:MAG: TolC family protein, partial [Thermoguttaceae bacterium]
MGPDGSNCRFGHGSPGKHLVATGWVLVAGTALLLASCTATGPVTTNSPVPPTANVLATASDRPAGTPVGETPSVANPPPYTNPPTYAMPASYTMPASFTTPPSYTIPAYYTSPVAPEPPVTNPAAAPVVDSSQPKPSNSPSNVAKPTPLVAAAQASPETVPLNVPTSTAPASGAQAEQAIAGVLQYATQHHPMLRVRQYEVEAARARIVTARLLPNPELTVDTLDSSAEPGPPELHTRLMFTLPTGPKRELRTAAAESGVCQAQLAMSRDTKLILTEAADAAVEVLYLQELHSLYGQLSALASQVVGIQQDRFNIAAVPYRSVVLTELSASRLELSRQNTAAQLDQAKVRLARAVGATDGTPPAVDGQLAVQPVAFAPVA